MDPNAPPPPDAAEVADRQTQSAPLGLGGNTAVKKKTKATTVGQKTRLSDKNKKPAAPEQNPGDVPLPQHQLRSSKFRRLKQLTPGLGADSQARLIFGTEAAG